MSKLNVNAIEPSTGTDITLGASGDTITVPSGATFTQSGTMNASAITAGTMATARLGSGTADATTFLRGDQTYATAGGTSKPYFVAERSAGQNIGDATATKIQFDTEIIDSDGCYDPSTNHRFTPTTEGKYVITCFCGITADANDAFVNGYLYIYKNGSHIGSAYQSDTTQTGRERPFCVSMIVDMNGSSDYVEMYASCDRTGGGNARVSGSNRAIFSGFKLID